jgi:hypothetical protein
MSKMTAAMEGGGVPDLFGKFCMVGIVGEKG